MVFPSPSVLELMSARSIAARSSTSSVASACRPLARASVRSADGKASSSGANGMTQAVSGKALVAITVVVNPGEVVLASHRPSIAAWEAPAMGANTGHRRLRWHRCQPGGQLPQQLEQHGLSLIAGVMGEA